MAGGLHNKASDRRRRAEVMQARAAWLLSADLASREWGADVRIVMQSRGTPGRGSHDEGTTTARKVACYLAQVVANVSGARLAEASMLDRATIHKHSQWVEDQRDDPSFDARVGELEGALFGMAARVVMAKLGQGWGEDDAQPVAA
ncbi:MAG: hypothetical protein DI570_09275 [Phenylobacterium zucineum]|nr:MAG: hypothetical protein DI570_09275 [Phenylobacterium zucineum]